MEKETQTNIFEYNDYREFLAKYYSNKKAQNPGYSHRVFAKQAGLSSPSHLSMIIKGERNLSHKTIAKFAEGMRLKVKEKKYFELLVLYGQAEDLHAKSKLFSEIMATKAALRGLHALEREKFEFLSKWYVVAIYVLLDLKDFTPDPSWISQRLGSRITATQAKEAFENLEKLGLIRADVTGRWVQVPGAVTVADDTRSIAVYNYHESMNRLALEALRTNSLEEREMNGATIAVPLEKLPEIKERIRAFRKEINQLASSFSDPDQIYQLNIQFFPLTVLEKKK